jgi:aflatoxin B1 aldehyde reductase
MKIILGSMTFGDQVDHQGAQQMVGTFDADGHCEVDTAYVYCGGKTETLLGEIKQDLAACKLATKVNPREGGLGKDSIDRQFSTSLQRLDVDAVDLLYLHQPDLDTPIEKSLAAINEHYAAGRISRFGLSNYAAWQVADIVRICEREGFITPTVYQGMYNALTRDVESELFPCLANFNIAFYVYNPLAGGMLTGKHHSQAQLPADGRFSTNTEYQNRYWKKDYFEAIENFANACKSEQTEPAAAALRWLTHHSALQSAKGDGIILGASKADHFNANLAATREGPLPDSIVAALDAGWELSRADCIKYFRP